MLFFLTAFRDFFLTHFSSMMRKNEQNTITGVAFYALGSFMSVVFFPPSHRHLLTNPLSFVSISLICQLVPTGFLAAIGALTVYWYYSSRKYRSESPSSSSTSSTSYSDPTSTSAVPARHSLLSRNRDISQPQLGARDAFVEFRKESFTWSEALVDWWLKKVCGGWIQLRTRAQWMVSAHIAIMIVVRTHNNTIQQLALVYRSSI